MKKPTKDEEFALYRKFSRMEKEQKAVYIKKLSPITVLQLSYTWEAWARENQLPPSGFWSTWVLKAGRGFGKTRSGAEWVIQKAQQHEKCHIALVGRTVADVRDVMIKGLSGILSISPPWFQPEYFPSKREIIWPNGSHATTYSADSPDQLRGPQHSFAWADERAAWQYDDAYDQLMFGLRISPEPGIEPQVVVTTTPRNTRAMKDLINDPTTVVTNGNTYDNRDNLSERFIREIERKYGGTRLGRQEIEGQIIDDIDGALWKRQWIEDLRLVKAPELKRVVVGIDPPGSSLATNDEAAECGIVVVGLGVDDHGFVLSDHSIIGTPNEWTNAGLTAYNLFKADCIVAENNFGGEMVEAVIRSAAKEIGMKNISIRMVHASRGKQIRAEPISNLYQQKRVHHVGTFPDLEDQMCNWVPGEKSPDRMDACVWGLTDLMIHQTISADEHIQWLKNKLEGNI